MANGLTRIILAVIAKSKPKGSALKSVLDPKAMQEKILNVKGNEKQNK